MDMDLQKEFDKFLADEGIELVPYQLETARAFIACNSWPLSWMRARRTGVTTLFNALEKFYKEHQIEPTAACSPKG